MWNRLLHGRVGSPESSSSSNPGCSWMNAPPPPPRYETFSMRMPNGTPELCGSWVDLNKLVSRQGCPVWVHAWLYAQSWIKVQELSSQGAASGTRHHLCCLTPMPLTRLYHLTYNIFPPRLIMLGSSSVPNQHQMEQLAKITGSSCNTSKPQSCQEQWIRVCR